MDAEKEELETVLALTAILRDRLARLDDAVLTTASGSAQEAALLLKLGSFASLRRSPPSPALQRAVLELQEKVHGLDHQLRLRMAAVTAGLKALANGVDGPSSSSRGVGRSLGSA
ncbi:hypothetical protein ACSSZE_08605 [Acidithiobacillus caldus]